MKLLKLLLKWVKSLFSKNKVVFQTKETIQTEAVSHYRRISKYHYLKESYKKTPAIDLTYRTA